MLAFLIGIKAAFIAAAVAVVTIIGTIDPPPKQKCTPAINGGEICQSINQVGEPQSTIYKP